MKSPLLVISVLFLAVTIDLACSRRIKRTIISGDGSVVAKGDVTNTKTVLMGVQTNGGNKEVPSTADAKDESSSDVGKQVSSPTVQGFGTYLAAIKTITANANAEATGNMTNTNNTLTAVQTDDGGQGVNYVSTGDAQGENNITVNNQASGAVQYSNGNYDGSGATGSVSAMGANSSGESIIKGGVVGSNNGVYSYQQGQSNGAGNTAAHMSGSAVVNQDGQVSPFSTENVHVNAGGTGSQQSASEVIAQQNITWDTIEADLIASAVGVGTNNANAHFDFGATNANGYGFNGNGMMSGTGGDQVNTQVNGNAQQVNDAQNLQMNQYGNAGGSGSASLVGAGSLNTNSDNNYSITTFGSGQTGVDAGSSSIEANQQSTLNSNDGGSAYNHVSATADGPQTNIIASNGIQANDQNGPTLVGGGGGIEASGNQIASGTMNVDSSYTQERDAQIVIST